MNTRISESFNNLSKQGQIMVQVLSLSSEEMIASAQGVSAVPNEGDQLRFSQRVKQLHAQRQLAGEILASEMERNDTDIELVFLRWFLEDLC